MKSHALTMMSIAMVLVSLEAGCSRAKTEAPPESASAPADDVALPPSDGAHADQSPRGGPSNPASPRDLQTALRDANTIIEKYSSRVERLVVRGSALTVEVRRGRPTGRTWMVDPRDLQRGPDIARLTEQTTVVQLTCKLADADRPTRCWRLDDEPGISNVGYAFDLGGSDAIAQDLAAALRDILHAIR